MSDSMVCIQSIGIGSTAFDEVLQLLDTLEWHIEHIFDMGHLGQIKRGAGLF